MYEQILLAFDILSILANIFKAVDKFKFDKKKITDLFELYKSIELYKKVPEIIENLD